MILCQAFGPSFFKDYHHFPFALIWSFSVSFFYVRLFLYRFFRLLYGATQDGPRWIRLLWFPFWHSNFNKLFGGGLQYKVIQTIFKWLLFFISEAVAFKKCITFSVILLQCEIMGFCEWRGLCRRRWERCARIEFEIRFGLLCLTPQVFTDVQSYKRCLWILILLSNFTFGFGGWPRDGAFAWCCSMCIRNPNPKFKNWFEYSGTQHMLQK